MAFTAVAAIVAGSEVTAALVLAAAAEVGTAMTVIGAVTGSKDLMKIGGAIALVGGIGGLVNGAISGAAAEGAATAAVDPAAYAGASADVGAANYVSAADAMSDAATAGTSGAGTGIVNSVAQPAVGTELAANQAGTTLQTPAQEMAQTTGAGGGNAAAAPVSSTTPTLQAPEVQGPAGAQGPSSPYDINLDPNSTPTDMRLNAGTQTAPQSASSYWSNIGNWINNNKTLFSSGMQLAGGALSGMNQRQMWDEKMQLERDRLAQTSHGSEIGNFAPRVSATPGIVNGAR
jgi:hypothetical protein